MKHDQSVTPGPSGVSRRTVVKGAAWAVPAIAIAGAVPAFASSPQCIQVVAAGSSCKCPGNSTGKPFGYNLFLCFSGTCNVGEDIYVTKIRVGQNDWLYTEIDGTELVTGTGTIYQAPKQCSDQEALNIVGYANSSPSNLYVFYSLDGGLTEEAVPLNLDAPPQDCIADYCDAA